jgi:hypothetical protein
MKAASSAAKGLFIALASPAISKYNQVSWFIVMNWRSIRKRGGGKWWRVEKRNWF